MDFYTTRHLRLLFIIVFGLNIIRTVTKQGMFLSKIKNRFKFAEISALLQPNYNSDLCK